MTSVDGGERGPGVGGSDVCSLNNLLSPHNQIMQVLIILSGCECVAVVSTRGAEQFESSCSH